MYFNGTDYYFFSGVKSMFRNMLHDNDIDNKDIIFVLKTKNFPFRSISRSINGKEKVVGIYNKAVINSYFNTKEKCEEIKRIIEYSSEDEIQKIIAELPKKTAPSSTQTKNENKEKMIAYLDRSPEEDMDYVSKQLLIDDGVMYESYDLQKTYPLLSTLKNGIYKGYRYAYTFELENGTKYQTKIGIKCSKKCCGGLKTFEICNGEIYEINEKLSDVDTDWKPKEGLFLSKSPSYIAKYLRDHSKDDGQAMKRLTFYMNRAGENLSNKTVLNKVKELLKAKD